jgi:hypothetical protein
MSTDYQPRFPGAKLYEAPARVCSPAARTTAATAPRPATAPTMATPTARPDAGTESAATARRCAEFFSAAAQDGDRATLEAAFALAGRLVNPAQAAAEAAQAAEDADLEAARQAFNAARQL